MAESRIKEYDGQTVVFEYTDKVEGVHRVERLSVYAFLGRLIRHIHDKHFRVIRYAGIYSTRTKAKDCATARALLGHTKKHVPPKTLWRERRMRDCGEDPLECGWCGAVMVLREIAYQARDGPHLKRVCG